MCTSEFIRFGYCSGVSFWTWEDSAALSIRLTRLKPRGPPRAGAHQITQGSMHLFKGRGMSRGPKKLEALGVLPWVNTALWKERRKLFI